jgi:hypothetical protein
MNVSRCKDVFSEEVQKAIQSLPKGKAPSLDGIPIKFFKITFLNMSIKYIKPSKKWEMCPMN